MGESSVRQKFEVSLAAYAIMNDSRKLPNRDSRFRVDPPGLILVVTRKDAENVILALVVNDTAITS